MPRPSRLPSSSARWRTCAARARSRRSASATRTARRSRRRSSTSTASGARTRSASSSACRTTASLARVRPVLAVLLATGAAAGATAAVLQPGHDAGAPPRAPVQRPLPAPDAALPRRPAALAAELAVTTRRLDAALGDWNPAGQVPRAVTSLALYQQRLLRLMAARRALGDATLARLPADVHGFAADTVRAQRSLAAIPRSPGRAPPLRVVRPAPAAELRGHYAAAQRRFGVPWSVLPALPFVDSAFGRLRPAS